MQNGVIKYNAFLRKEELNKLKYENPEYLVADERTNIIPIPNNNILYEMPKE